MPAWGSGSHLGLCEWSPRPGARPGMLTSVCPHTYIQSVTKFSEAYLSPSISTDSTLMWAPHPSSDSPGAAAHTAPPQLVHLVERVILSIPALLAGSAGWAFAPSCQPQPLVPLLVFLCTLHPNMFIHLLPLSPTRLLAGALLC